MYPRIPWELFADPLGSAPLPRDPRRTLKEPVPWSVPHVVSDTPHSYSTQSSPTTSHVNADFTTNISEILCPSITNSWRRRQEPSGNRRTACPFHIQTVAPLERTSLYSRYIFKQLFLAKTGYKGILLQEYIKTWRPVIWKNAEQRQQQVNFRR